MSAPPAERISEETLASITKATTTGILESTGLYSYDLSGLVSLVPVVTPFRDIVARVTVADANPNATWRAIMNTTNSQPDPSMGWDMAASEVVVQEQDFQVPYMPTGLAGNTTQDAFDMAKGYADPYAVMTFNTLNQVLIGDDRKQLCAQSFPLTAASAPTLTQHSSGGTISNVTVYVGVAGRTGSGYFYGSGNSQGASSSTTFSGGSANSVTAGTTALKGALCYDWFQSSNGVNWYYYTTTTVNTVTMTSVITQNSALPGINACPDLSTTWQNVRNSVPTYLATGDNGSGNAKDYNGFMASLTGDYTSNGMWAQPGTATPNPAVWNSLNGAAMTLDGGSVTEIEQYLFMPIFQQVKCSPTALMMNATLAQEIANLVLGSPSATTFLNTDSSGRISTTAGGRVGAIINTPAGGQPVPIEVHVSLPPGTIIARTDRVPFPQADITNVLEQRCVRDTAQFDYAAARVANTPGGGPRKEFEIRSVSAFANRAPVAMAVLQNVA